jgi:hypothetical protein
MENDKSKLLLVLGCQRSGTTLLAAMLGGHSEVNMLFESTTKDVLRLIGKKYHGNKLLTWRQIRMHQQSSNFGHIVNRIANAHFRKNKHHSIRLFPTSPLSVQDYIERNAAVITIVREKDEVLDSIVSRTKMTRAQADNEYHHSAELINKLGNRAHHVQFSDLIHNPVETLAGVCQFLGLDFEERMLKGVEYNFVYPNSSLIKEKSKV